MIRVLVENPAVKAVWLQTESLMHELRVDFERAMFQFLTIDAFPVYAINIRLALWTSLIDVCLRVCL